MKFHMEANPGSEEGVLSNFELDLKFTAAAQRPSKSRSQASPGAPLEVLSDDPEVCLIGAPAPRYITHTARVWRFWSNRLSDDDSGVAMAARWIWESNASQELKGRVLHCGVALHHLGEPFRVTCQVRGKVSKPGGIILKFSNQHHEPRSWLLVPQACDENLQGYIEKLQVSMEKLNSPIYLCDRESEQQLFLSDFAKLLTDI